MKKGASASPTPPTTTSFRLFRTQLANDARNHSAFFGLSPKLFSVLCRRRFVCLCFLTLLSCRNHSSSGQSRIMNAFLRMLMIVPIGHERLLDKDHL